MTNEEWENAIRCLKLWIEREPQIQTYKTCLEALEQQPCERFEWGIDGKVYKITKAKDGKEICQQVCKDAISRQAVLNTLDNMDKALDEDRTVENYKELLKECYEVLPSVTPQQKYGKWIDYRDEGFVECPFCGHATNCEDNIDELHYCFYCGARLQESEE